MSDPIRLQVLDGIVAHLKTIDTLPDPENLNAGVAFSIVEHGPLSDADGRQLYACGVVEQGERTFELTMVSENSLTVALEFRARIQKGQKPARIANQVLAELKYAMLNDGTFGNTAIDTVASGSEIDLQTYGDKSAAGVAYFIVKYRHAERDPFSPV